MELGDSELDRRRASGRPARRLARRARAAGIDPAGAELDDAAVGSFRAHMDDDFGTPAAVAVIFDTAQWANAGDRPR